MNLLPAMYVSHDITETLQFLCSCFFRYFCKRSYRIGIISSRFVWSIDGTLTGITTPGQRELKSNGNEGVFHRTEASPSDTVYRHMQMTTFHRGQSYPLAGDSISQSQIGCWICRRKFIWIVFFFLFICDSHFEGWVLAAEKEKLNW